MKEGINILYFGKFSSKYPEQIKEKFYAGGPRGSESYGGIRPGDYVFPIYEGKIESLWRVNEYTNRLNNINKTGVVEFEVVKTFEPLRLSNEFVRYKFFELDINLLNRSAKSFSHMGFLPIKTSPDSPEPQDINFANNLRKIFVALEDKELSMQPGDIRVTINNLPEKKIKVFIYGMEMITAIIDVLWDLYLKRNPEGERYSLDKLLDFALKDNAPMKQKYLESVIKDFGRNRSFLECQVRLPFMTILLVGRKRVVLPR